MADDGSRPAQAGRPLTDYRFEVTSCERLWTDREHYYSVLVDRGRRVAILEVVITSIVWYSVYFWLPQDEYDLFEADREAFSKLTYSYAADKGERAFRHRLLRNEGPGGDKLPGSPPVALETLQSPGPS